MKKRVLLDCDGVMSDFISRVIFEVNRDMGTTFTYVQVTEWELYDALDVPKDVAARIDAICRQPGFCASLKPIAGARDGVERLRREYEVYCVTAPFPKSKFWIDERITWLRDHMWFRDNEIIPTSAKYMIAGDILIDDKIANLDTWCLEPHAGQPLLFRQPWNFDKSSYLMVDWNNMMHVVESELRHIDDRVWEVI